MPNTKLYLCACAGSALTMTAAEPATAPESSPPPFYRPLTLGVEAGTTGVGGSLGWRFAAHWGVRSGFDYFRSSENDVDIKDLTYSAKLRLLSEPLTLDLYPWKKHSFHISVGALFNQNRLTGTASGTGTIIINGQPFLTDLVGTLNLKIEQQPVNPYLTIGGNFFYFDRAHRWAMGGELGVAYTGDQKVSLTRSGPSAPLIDAAVRAEQTRVQDYADEHYKWLPVVKLTVNYSF